MQHFYLQVLFVCSLFFLNISVCPSKTLQAKMLNLLKRAGKCLCVATSSFPLHAVFCPVLLPIGVWSFPDLLYVTNLVEECRIWHLK